MKDLVDEGGVRRQVGVVRRQSLEPLSGLGIVLEVDSWIRCSNISLLLFALRKRVYDPGVAKQPEHLGVGHSGSREGDKEVGKRSDFELQQSDRVILSALKLRTDRAIPGDSAGNVAEEIPQ